MIFPDSPLQVVFLDRETLPPAAVLAELPFPHRLIIYPHSTTDEAVSRIRDADIVITNKVRIDAKTIAAAPRLAMIAVAATGTDNIDLDACAARSIVVSNIRGYAVHTVPEHTFALIFALRRSLLAYRDAVRSGRWQASGQFCFFDFPIKDLHGATLGVIGDGTLGRAVAEIGRALGMRVRLAARKHRPCPDDGIHVPFEEVISQSDVITLHCPLNDANHHMIGAAEFAAMTRRPLIINTARGGLVDEAALVLALESGMISGAGFDVTSEEPMPVGHPFHSLANHPGFILTPHVAWASEEATQTLADQLVSNICAFVRGSPVNVQTPNRDSASHSGA
ncbi:D-2-hydroxyacid dehydrogenase [Burkholderia gladioli]|uniref:D-2-hydroxyacid dehydrogenase n=1 Tax=Burkholderia gladioli TaxID=28095 RepID=UPI001640DFEA|nr:D-2-hydroxyacid dehydrogenase [Burkholderia gladioli]